MRSSSGLFVQVTPAWNLLWQPKIVNPDIQNFSVHKASRVFFKFNCEPFLGVKNLAKLVVLRQLTGRHSCWLLYYVKSS